VQLVVAEFFDAAGKRAFEKSLGNDHATP
jgi:hypothetical protein